ncbi:MAG: hypothetical protein EXS31_09910 [Pedosphaera sp.]|nr:hypothetical protein [Pedosphaera sp.]
MQEQSATKTDRELLRAFKKEGSPENFRLLLDRYLPFVFDAARRQTANDTQASEATCAAFFAFARSVRSLSRNTVLAGWLFKATRLAALKLQRISKQQASPALSAREVSRQPEAIVDSRTRFLPLLDPALDKLSLKLRDAVLVHLVLNRNWGETVQILRIRESRTRKRVAKGTWKLARLLRKRGLRLDDEAVRSLCVGIGSCSTVPESLAAEILDRIPVRRTSGPAFALTRSTLAALTWAKWKRWMATALKGTAGLAIPIGFLMLGVYLAFTKGPLLSWIIEWSMRQNASKAPELVQPARPWPANPAHPLPSAANVRTSDDLFQVTNVWKAHLKFSADQWQAVAPKRIPPLPGMMPTDGKFILKNPKAKRSGLSGVLGFEFDWAHADFEFGGSTFQNVAARIKGNGTFLGSLSGLKRSFKVNLDKFNKDQALGETDVVNFTNLIEDRSYMADALGHEFFRDCGVPAPRTAYAYLDLSVDGQFEHKALGLYLVVENIDGAFAKHQFENKSAPIFKPVTYKLFEDIGDDWSAYAGIYDVKTKANEAQQRRVIEFAKLVSHADDAEFARRLGEFLDYDAFARFLGALTLIASYDGLFSNGQNFYAYLDPRSNKFGLIPWDLDHSWGNFPFIGTAETRERSSIWHPWVGENRFLDRVMRVEEFRKIYRERMEELLATKFTSQRLGRRIDELAAAIRDPISAESMFRRERFDEAVSGEIVPRWTGDPFDALRTAHQLKRFIAARSRSVRSQLDGKSKGFVLDRVMPNQ